MILQNPSILKRSGAWDIGLRYRIKFVIVYIFISNFILRKYKASNFISLDLDDMKFDAFSMENQLERTRFVFHNK